MLLHLRHVGHDMAAKKNPGGWRRPDRSIQNVELRRRYDAERASI
jgi:hypothetical protein